MYISCVHFLGKRSPYLRQDCILGKFTECYPDIPPTQVSPEDALHWLKGCHDHAITLMFNSPLRNASMDDTAQIVFLPIKAAVVFAIMDEILYSMRKLPEGTCYVKIPAGRNTVYGSNVSIWLCNYLAYFPHCL